MVWMHYNLYVISNEDEVLITDLIYVYALPYIYFIQLYYVAMVHNIDKYVLATPLNFSCYVSITYNWMYAILPLDTAPRIVLPS